MNPESGYAYVVSRSDGTITELTDPGHVDDVIAVPVHWCVVEGSDLAAGLTIPGEATEFWPTDSIVTPLIDILYAAAAEAWMPSGAHIKFWGTSLIPIIRDPQRPNGSNGELGDLTFDNDYEEMSEAGHECRDAWHRKYPNEAEGIIAVYARAFYQNGPTSGLTHYDPNTIRTTPTCTFPRTLDRTNHAVAMAVQQFKDMPNFGHDALQTVTHELGHALGLGHGNGLDDNHNGTSPPDPGPRLFDEWCDPDEVDAPECQECSLMAATAGDGHTLTQLQIEAAREYARMYRNQ